ncbi:MAG: hypothetical protein ACTSVS_00020 [Candidatus Heimdallarchaeota archaeon]
MFRIPNPLSSILQGFMDLTKIVNSIMTYFVKPFAQLSKQSTEILQSLYSTPTFEWRYVTEPEYHLRILESEKDATVLDLIKKMADELFE